MREKVKIKKKLICYSGTVMHYPDHNLKIKTVNKNIMNEN